MAVRSVEAHMSEPAAYDADFDAGFQQANSSSVPKQVRTDLLGIGPFVSKNEQCRRTIL